MAVGHGPEERTPKDEFEAWLAANTVELPDHRRHQLRPIGRPLTTQAARRRLLAVALGLVVAVIAVTGLLTLIGRA